VFYEMANMVFASRSRYSISTDRHAVARHFGRVDCDRNGVRPWRVETVSRILTRIRNPGTAMLLIFLIWMILDDNFIHFKHGDAMTLVLAVIAIIVILVEGRRAR
jgi:hypothetical protein